MAPEQAKGEAKSVGPAADVWALGVILYECLTGRRPFEAADLFGLLQQVAAADPLPPRRVAADVPRDLEAICLTCLARDPARRYQTAWALADDLDRFLGGKPISARPQTWWSRVIRWARR
jgi:serine/threonine protein kinase